eukprot:g39883.t1
MAKARTDIALSIFSMSKRKEDLSEGSLPIKRIKTEDTKDYEAEEDKTTKGKTVTTNGQSGDSLPPNSHLNEGDVGIIESISLKNFMCHACLGPFKFGPNVNFVVGNNG